MNVPGGTTPAEPKVIDMDVMRADLLQLAEEGDFQTIERVIVKVLGRRYHGCIRMHANHVPLSLPAASLPQDGVYATARPWAETRGPASFGDHAYILPGRAVARRRRDSNHRFDRGYEAGVYVVVGSTPGASPAFADFSDLGSAEWRATAGRQPTLTGFEKKNAGAAYRVGPETWSMKGVASAGPRGKRSRLQRDFTCSTVSRVARALRTQVAAQVLPPRARRARALERGLPARRHLPDRRQAVAHPAGPAAAPARAEQGGDQEPGPAPAPAPPPGDGEPAPPARSDDVGPGPAPPRKNEPAP